ncbi:bidirectional sugar transporter SWEET14-like [Impatiens glandulifera]|uniref:bidirectional sugar transporter SWEET14-like n=1 Tax=Impatiens glandulifera TaxID=253017 RepID=UPI001FB12BA7|nr:bidirectional sugar transporter SWEET14-like [Impatiens glandulifera]
MTMLQHPLVYVFGILGNIISFGVFLAPIPTFYKIVKKKSTQGFQSVPYLIALFSCMLWIYYALVKTNAFFLITINSIGCVIETIYIVIFLIYATKNSRILTVKILVLLNIGVLSLIVLLTHFLVKSTSKRLKILGWICLVFNITVFVAPLGVLKQVIRTKSAEFMPFPLSACLTLNAVAWFFYGLLLKDYFIALPNILGFVFGIIQMILYFIYKNHKDGPKQQMAMNSIVTDPKDTIDAAHHGLENPVCISLPISQAIVQENHQRDHSQPSFGQV